MERNDIHRPWMRKHQVKKYKDPFYTTKHWQNLRAQWLLMEPQVKLPAIQRRLYNNQYCMECWKGGKITAMKVLDHIKRREDGGTDTFDNFQSLCAHHHDQKRAREKNEKYKR